MYDPPEKPNPDFLTELDSGSIKTSPRDGLRVIGKEMYTMILELEILKK